MRLRLGYMGVACCDYVSLVYLVDFRLLVFDFHNVVVSFLKNFNIRLPLPRGGTLCVAYVMHRMPSIGVYSSTCIPFKHN